MPIEDYPPDIAHADFQDPHDNYGTTGTPISWISENVFARGRTDLVMGINHVVIPARANTALWIHAQHADSTSVHAPHVGAQNIAFSIAPHNEVGMEIRWRFANPNNLRKAKLELFGRGDAAPIWTLKWKRRDTQNGFQLIPGNLPNLFVNAVAGGGGHDGAMAWDGGIQPVGNRQADFPDNCVTAAHSPYKLKLTAGGPGGHVERAWTYFHVKVHDLQLFWGTAAQVPAPPAVNPIARQAEIVNAEQAILAALPMNGMTRRINAGAPHDIVLPSNAFCPSLASLNLTHNAYLMYEGLWGDGPRLPLVALARITDSGGNPVVEGRALGTLEVLWDWTSDPERGVGGRRAAMGHANTVDVFLDDALDYRRGMHNDSPHESDNCHADRGGKRGAGAAPVFLPHAGSVAFPFVTQACQDRPWAIRSQFVRTHGNANEGKTGVYFSPSRMAGDSYRVVAYLAHQRQPNRRPWLDQRISHTTFQNDIAGNARPLPHEATQLFTIRRQVDLAHYVTKDGNPLNGLVVANIAPHFAHAFLDLQVPGGATAMVQADYDQDFANATAGMAAYFNGATNNLFTQALPAAQYLGHGVGAPSLWAVSYNPWNGALMGGNTAQFQGAVVGALNYDNYCAQTLTSDILKFFTREYRAQRFGGVAGAVLFHFDGADNHARELGAAVFPQAVVGISSPEGAAHASFPAGMGGAKPMINLVVHELAHTLNLQHAPSHAGILAGGTDPASHDAGHCCVMNYDIAGVDFCAMCLFVLRGWDIRGMATAAGNNNAP